MSEPDYSKMNEAQVRAELAKYRHPFKSVPQGYDPTMKMPDDNPDESMESSYPEESGEPDYSKMNAEEVIAELAKYGIKASLPEKKEAPVEDTRSFVQRRIDGLKGGVNWLAEQADSASQGAAQGLMDIGSFPLNIARKLGGLEPLETNINKIYGLPEAQFPTIKGAAQLLPSLALPGVKGAQALSKVFPMLTKLKLIPAAIDTAATGAAYGAGFGANNPNETLMGGAKSGAITGLGLGAGLGVASKGVGALGGAATNLTGKYFRNRLENYSGSAPERLMDMKRNLEVSEDIPIDIGSILNHKPLKTLYEYLRFSPFSGAVSKAEQSIEMTNKQATKFGKSLLGDVTDAEGKAHPAMIYDVIKAAVKSSRNAIRKIKNDKYEQAFADADKAGFNMTEAPHLQSTAQAWLQKHNKARVDSFSKDVLDFDAVKTAVRILGPGKLDPRTYQALSKGRSNEELDDLADIMMERSENPQRSLRDMAEELKSFKRKRKVAYSTIDKDKEGTYSFYNDVLSSAEKDIDQHLKSLFKLTLVRNGKSGENPSLAKTAYENWGLANKFYKQHYLPYKDKAIQKITDESWTPENIGSSLKRPESQAILEHLDPSIRSLIAATEPSFIKKLQASTIPRLTPASISKVNANMTPAQRGRTFTKKQQTEAEDIELLGQLTHTARVAKNKPETGVKGNALMKGLATAGATLGLAGLEATHPKETNEYLIPSLIMSMILNRKGTNFLTSSNLKKAILKKKLTKGYSLSVDEIKNLSQKLALPILQNKNRQ